MTYVPFIIIFVTLICPVFVPLIYWYILRKKDSKIYRYCRYARRFWALMIVVMIVFKIFKLQELEGFNTYEKIGEFFGQFLMSLLLWKKWGHGNDLEERHGILNEKN
jgi:hypothetical protein